LTENTGIPAFKTQHLLSYKINYRKWIICTGYAVLCKSRGN